MLDVLLYGSLLLLCFFSGVICFDLFVEFSLNLLVVSWNSLRESVWKWFIFFSVTNFVSFCFILFSWICQLLLGYLSPDRSLWSSELAKKRLQYKQFKEELLMNPVSLFLWFDTRTLYWWVFKEKINGLNRVSFFWGDVPLNLVDRIEDDYSD